VIKLGIICPEFDGFKTIDSVKRTLRSPGWGEEERLILDKLIHSYVPRFLRRLFNLSPRSPEQRLPGGWKPISCLPWINSETPPATLPTGASSKKGREQGLLRFFTPKTIPRFKTRTEDFRSVILDKLTPSGAFGPGSRNALGPERPLNGIMGKGTISNIGLTLTQEVYTTCQKD
jgi:hypothetical protein